MDIGNLQGVGVKRKAVLNENGIFTCKDIVNYFPNKYLNLSLIEGFKADGKNRLIKVTLTEDAKVIRIKGGLNYTSAKVVDSEGNKFTCVWFNQPYMKSKLVAFNEYYVYGKNSPTKKNNFVVQRLVRNQETSYLSLYKTMDGIGQTTIQNLVKQSLDVVDSSSLLDSEFDMDLTTAIKECHNPTNNEILEKAKERIMYEKAMLLVSAIENSKNTTKCRKTQKYANICEIYAKFCKKLPFSLTLSQQEVVKELINDMTSDFKINRVIDGDVGSGKTILALFSMYVASENNYSSIMLAPTELLATQHYKQAKNLFGDKVLLLTASIKGKEKKELLEYIKNNSGLMIFGTHALFSSNVIYNNLSMIVVDEQHRFGVSERAKIATKGLTPDMISMSATPIPRTLSLILRGDADVSVVAKRPFDSLVQTNIVSSLKEEDMWKFIDERITNGSKVFVVCSKIGDDEDDDLIDYSASSMYKKLKSKINHKIELLTGILSAEEKNKILSNFDRGETKLIVATTIVEVGIDIPDSDIMVIATPEMFGLASLHQLRGRVGRNGSKAYCFCLVRDLNESALDRLRFFTKTNDGFRLADYDYENRGAGDIYGTKQHGKGFDTIKGVSLKVFTDSKKMLECIKETNINLYEKIVNKAKEEFEDNFTKVILN